MIVDQVTFRTMFTLKDIDAKPSGEKLKFNFTETAAEHGGDDRKHSYHSHLCNGEYPTELVAHTQRFIETINVLNLENDQFWFEEFPKTLTGTVRREWIELYAAKPEGTPLTFDLWKATVRTFLRIYVPEYDVSQAALYALAGLKKPHHMSVDSFRYKLDLCNDYLALLNAGSRLTPSQVKDAFYTAHNSLR